MPKSPQEILADPKFQGLPLGEQLKVMRTVDPNFSALPEKEQGTVIAKSRQKSLGYDKIGQKPKDAGFGTTLLNDVASIPGALTATGTGEKGDTRPPGIVPQIGAAQHEQFEKGRQDFEQGNYLSSAGHTLAGAVPVLGPLAAQTGEEIGEGQYGQAAAHGVELLSPEIPGGKIARGARDVAKAVGKAMPDIHPLAKMAAKRVPGVSTAIDIGEYLKKKYGKPPEPTAPVVKDPAGIQPDRKLTFDPKEKRGGTAPSRSATGAEPGAGQGFTRSSPRSPGITDPKALAKPSPVPTVEDPAGIQPTRRLEFDPKAKRGGTAPGKSARGSEPGAGKGYSGERSGVSPRSTLQSPKAVESSAVAPAKAVNASAKVVDFLKSFGFTSEHIANMTDADWNLVAEQSGAGKLDAATRKQIVESLKPVPVSRQVRRR